MNPFRKEKISGLPDHRDTNEHERSPEQLGVMRSLKKEYGSDRIVTQLNEKINKGENIGEYQEDELSQKIRELENKRKEILSDEKISDCYRQTKELILIQADIGDLEREIESVLLSDGKEDTGHNEKILLYNNKSKDIEDISNKINEAGEDAIKKVGEIFRIDNEIQRLKSEHKENFGDQSIKSEQGQFLN